MVNRNDGKQRNVRVIEQQLNQSKNRTRSSELGPPRSVVETKFVSSRLLSEAAHRPSPAKKKT